VQIRKSGIFLILLSALCAVTAALSAGETRVLIERFVVAFVFGGLGLFMAEASGLKGSLILASSDARSIPGDVVFYGMAPGILLGAINYYFFFSYRYSRFVVPRIRNIDSVTDSFLLSVEIALAEEVIYRLFILSCIYYTARYFYRRVQPASSRSSAAPALVALTASSLVFAFAHRSPYSLTAAFLGGMVLGLIYMRKGVEPAIAAHFAANFLFFNASYLDVP
jgi:membrane protease YdiL (CAAX protease family)